MFNLAQASTDVNRIELVVIKDTDTAYNFGLEDAQEGVDMRGSMYYKIKSAQWTAYNQGYAEGWRGDPSLLAWLLEGSPTVGFCFDGEFSDVEPEWNREEWVGA